MEQARSFVVVNLPITADDLGRLKQMLLQENPFCSSFPDRHLYEVMFYHEQKGFHGTETRMLLDQNVYSRLLKLAKGTKASADYRLPAAVMAFAQYANILLEPSIAISEAVSTQESKDLAWDLAYFRALDNLHPKNLLDIALGRTNTIQDPLDLHPDSGDLDGLNHRVRQFTVVYPLVLKIGLIELEGGKQTERMRKFLDWMHSEWYFSAPVSVFASMCFSGRVPGGVLKNLRNVDRQLALKGLKNAAWDLAYLTYWGQQIQRQERECSLWLLCSLDKALRSVASRLFTTHDHVDESLKASLCELMGKISGNAVFEYYSELRDRIDDTSRAINRTEGEERIAHHRKTEAFLENAILNP